MTVKILKSDKEEAVFQIEIDAKIFEDAVIKEYKTATKGQDITPETVLLNDRALLAQYPELDKISGIALDKLLPTYYMNAIKELGLTPMTYPKVMPKESKIGEPCVIDVRIAIEPKIELKQYEGLEALYSPVLVVEGDVDERVASLRQQHGDSKGDEKLLKKLPFDSIEALMDEIRSSLDSIASEKTEFNKKDAVMKQFLEVNPCPLSEEIIEQQIMIEINQGRKQMGAQAMDHYMKTSGRTIDDVKKEVRPQAESTVKKNLLLTAVVDKISPEVTEDDIKSAISKHQNSFQGLVTDYESRRKEMEKNHGAMDQLKHAIRLEKAANYIVSKAIFREGEPVKIMDQIPEYLR